jgi:cell division protein FtsB
MPNRSSISLVPFVICSICFLISLYFSFAAIQGELGVLKRLEAETQVVSLNKELSNLKIEMAHLKNKIARLSVDYLDLDLLDFRAREVLGLMRPEEIIIK